MGEATTFYEALGFTVSAYDETYAWVSHGAHELLHLRLDLDLEPSDNRSAVYLHVQDVARRHAEWSSAGAGSIQDMPWGMREFTMSDPSGNVLRIGANL